jgi:hypothetical protein
MRLPLGALALALGAAGCGGSIGGGPVALDDFEPELTDAACAYLVACERLPDRATCLASRPFPFTALATLKADVAAGIVTYDGQAARACIDAFKRRTSCKSAQWGDPQVALAACERVFLGTVPTGGACWFNEECADGGACTRLDCTTPGCCAGTCLARPAPVPAGGDCSNLVADQHCVAGTVCISGTCTLPLAPGARCALFDSCVLPYECRNIDPATNMGTCTPPPERGQPCGVGDVASACNDERDNCDYVAHVCAAGIPVGGACTFGYPPFCVDYAECEGSTCVQRPGLGAACDPLLPASECLGSLACDAATALCTPRPGGESCR